MMGWTARLSRRRLDMKMEPDGSRGTKARLFDPGPFR
jgi:hypothetical protein